MKSKLNDLSDPNFNPICIQGKIDELDKEIVKMQTIYLTKGLPHDEVTVLQSKIAIRESLIVRLKSLELLNKSE